MDKTPAMKNLVKKAACNPFFLGIFFFLVQLIIILLLCPETTWQASWLSLASHWDSLWYETIAQYGYRILTMPNGEVVIAMNQWGWPSSFQAPSNVVFFPAYPYVARLITLVFGVKVNVALLLVSQGSTLLFWCLLFYMLRGIEWSKQLYAAILILSFPTSWFLFMGYSEGLFTLSTCLMLWLATQKRYVLSGISGMIMTSTRLIGVPLVIAPLLSGMVAHSPNFKTFFNLKHYYSNFKIYAPFFLIAIIALLGFLGFLIYCEIYFGSWHIYFDLNNRGWRGGTVDPLFLFDSSIWIPAFSLSKILLSTFLWLFVLSSVLMFRKQYQLDQKSLTWYFAALLLFLFSCFAISSRDYNGINRYLHPVWILLVISDVIHPNNGLFFRMKHDTLYRFFMPTIIIISLYYWFQLLNTFFLNGWVA